MATYSNPVTQVGAQNKDLGAASQAELTRILIGSSVTQATTRRELTKRLRDRL